MTEKECEAAICGLFCGSCPMYPAECGGCLSDRPAGGCIHCYNGFRDCARRHGVTWCFQCGEFPCALLEDFRGKHWENGVCHHSAVVDNLRRMAETGVEKWVDEERARTRCPTCGRLIPWNARQCPCARSDAQKA